MLRRLTNLIRGFFGLFVSGLERRSPEALLEVEKENLRAQVARFNQGLASHAALCERLMAQTKKLEAEEADLKAKTGAHLRAGNREVAGQYALRLQTTSRELTENRAQLRQAEETYAAMSLSRDEAVKAAQAKIDALRQSIDGLKTQRALAELSEMAAGMNTAVGGAGDTLDRLRVMVDEEKARAAGKARVARDAVAGPEAALQEAERRALAEHALAEFVAKESPPLALPAGTEPPALPTKSPDQLPERKW